MIELGTKQKLLVVKKVEFGVYLAEDKNADAKDRVLLPGRQVPEGTKREMSLLSFFIRILLTVLLRLQKSRLLCWERQLFLK